MATDPRFKSSALQVYKAFVFQSWQCTRSGLGWTFSPLFLPHVALDHCYYWCLVFLFLELRRISQEMEDEGLQLSKILPSCYDVSLTMLPALVLAAGQHKVCSSVTLCVKCAHSKCIFCKLFFSLCKHIFIAPSRPVAPMLRQPS